MKSYIMKVKKFLKQLKTLNSFDVKPSFSQIIDMVVLGLRYGFSPLEYNLYDFKDISRKERLSYISNEEIIKKLRPTLNNKKWASILENKLFFSLFYTPFGLPLVDIYGFYYPGKGFFLDGTPLRNKEDFLVWFQKMRIKNLVVKPVASLGGKGIMIFSEFISSDVVRSNDGKSYSIDEVFSFMDNDINGRQRKEDPYQGYIIEEKLEQDISMKIFGSSLNTVRVSTLRKKSGEILIDFAMLRMGEKGSITDNLHQGGYVVNINVEDGTLANTVFGYRDKEGPWIEEKEVKIDELFEDRKIPYWRDILLLARKAAYLSPDLSSIGWDIAISKDGTILMEGNENWDIVIAQVIDGGYITERRKGILKQYGLEF